MRAIAGALGVGKSTIDRDLSTVPSGTVQDDIDELTTTSKLDRPEKALGLDAAPSATYGGTGQPSSDTY